VRALAPFARSQTQAAISIERTGGAPSVRLSTGPVPLVTPTSPSTISGASGAMQTAAPARKRWPIVAGIVLAGGLGAAIVVATGRSGGGHPAVVTPATVSAPQPAPPPPLVAQPPPPQHESGSAAGSAELASGSAMGSAELASGSATGSAEVASGSAAQSTVPSHVVHTHRPKHPPHPPSGSKPADDDILGARH
jgi:hypothetical protein